MQQEYFFETQGYVVGYDGVPVISNIEIRLKQGEILTLIGANGAGKTTIIKSIIGQLSKIAGVALLEKQPMDQISGKLLAKQMSVVLTNRVQTEMMSVQAVVETGRYPYTGKFGVLSEKDHEIVENVMKTIQIFDIRNQDFSKLSDGQRQKVMLARALAQEPQILVLDEPTSFLDIRHKMEFLSIVRRLAKEKKLTVIMSLHEVELAQLVSDQLACFKQGRMDRYGSPEEVLKDGYLLELYDIRLEKLDEVFWDYLK